MNKGTTNLNPSLVMVTFSAIYHSIPQHLVALVSNVVNTLMVAQITWSEVIVSVHRSPLAAIVIICISIISTLKKILQDEKLITGKMIY